MAGRVHGTNSGALNPKDLAVHNGLLTLARRVFVDCVTEARIKTKKIGNSTSVIAVPVGEEDMRQGDGGVNEGRGDQIGPLREPLGGVDYQSPFPRTDNVGVCSLKRELEPSLDAALM